MFSKHCKYSVTIILTQCPLPLKPRQITRLTPTQERTGHKPTENWSSCSKKRPPHSLDAESTVHLLPCPAHCEIAPRCGWVGMAGQGASERGTRTGTTSTRQDPGTECGPSLLPRSASVPRKVTRLWQRNFFYDVWRSPGLSR